MKKSDCKNCKYSLDMEAIGQGIRCTNPTNQKYNDDKKLVPTVIVDIPECELFEEKGTQ